MENGKWARFVEIGTGKALYFDRDRIRVDSVEELHPEALPERLVRRLVSDHDTLGRVQVMLHDERHAHS